MIPGKVKVKLTAKECEILKNFTYELLQASPGTDHQAKLNLISLMPFFRRLSVALLFPKKENKFSIPVTEALSFLILYKSADFAVNTGDLVTIRQFISIIDKTTI
jgi:hypothetical protein